MDRPVNPFIIGDQARPLGTPTTKTAAGITGRED